MRTLEERIAATLVPSPGEPSATDFRTSGAWYPLAPALSFVTNATPTNYLFAFPFGVRRPRTIDRIGAEVTTGVATAVLRLGLYTDDDGAPGQLIADYGTLDGATTAVPTPITISQALARGVYWCAYVQQTATATWRAQTSPMTAGRTSETTAAQNVTLLAVQSGVSGALPAQFVVDSDPGSQPNHVRILARAA